jgi:HAD superfamily hydrolase (TIGR01509 family)
MLKAIFWDNDGVLVDTEKLYYRANKEIFKKIGIELTKEIYTDNFLIKGKGAWHLAEKIGFTNEQIEALRVERNSLYGELLSKEKMLLDGIPEILSRLSKKYLMGIITSSRRDHFNIIHTNTRIIQYFDFVLTGEDFKRLKPDPEPYLLALEKTKMKKEECIIIEDSERGLTAALSAGIKCIIIPHELTEKCKFSGAYKILSSIHELIPVIENL